MIANTNLGVLYTNMEEWDKAIERYQVLLKGNEAIVYGNLAECLQAKGELEKAAETLQSFLKTEPDSAAIHARLGQVYALEGQTELALKECDRAGALNPGDINFLLGKAIILFLRDDLAGAEAELQQLLRGGSPIAAMMVRGQLANVYGYQGKIGKAIEQAKLGFELARKVGDSQAIASFLIPLSYVHQKMGDFQVALQELAEARRLAAASDYPGLERSILRARGLAEVAAKSVAQAERTAAELKGLCEQSANPREIRLYFGLQGSIELEKDNFAKAIELLEQALSLSAWALPVGWDLDAMAALGAAYRGMGDKNKALDTLQKIVSSPQGRLNNAYVYVTGLYELGKLCQEMGLKDRARENLGKFLDIWKNADPGIPQVEDARKRLAGL
jgi:tetratricopeptide (TPR) repeat protein